MADDKKRDDYSIEVSNTGKNYEQPINSPRPSGPTPMTAVASNPIFPVLSYCGSSILMTVTNKYVLSGFGFNLNFFLLCVQVCLQGPWMVTPALINLQSVVCVAAIQMCKSSGIITYRDFNSDEARKCERRGFMKMETRHINVFL